MQMIEKGSFHIGVFQDHIERITWHYHQEFELSFITEGSGRRIVGDSVEDFHPGDLILLGPRIPHVWYPEALKANFHSGRTLESVYLQFNHDILPPGLTQLREFDSVNRAVRHAERGIRITGETLNKVSGIMLQMPYLPSMKRLMHFYDIMDTIGRSRSFHFLAGEEYVRSRFSTSHQRVKQIHEYLIKNYLEEISLEKIAGIVHMAPASVCRFYKSVTGMTIFESLNKIKVDYACQLLLNTDHTVVHISYDCGFNNLSHFNKQFRKVTGTTPSEYRKFRQPSLELS